MKRYLPCFGLLLLVLGIAAGCKKDDAVTKNATAKPVQDVISGVNGPTSGSINEELKFNILWDNADTTLRFHHLQDTVDHNIHIIKLFVSAKPNDSTQVIKPNSNLIYKFKPTVAGTYYLKFYKPENTDQSAIIDTVVITK